MPFGDLEVFEHWTHAHNKRDQDDLVAFAEHVLQALVRVSGSSSSVVKVDADVR